MAKTLKDRTEQELAEELAKKRASLREMRFGAAGSRSRNPHAPRELRKDIARILTELNARART